MRKWSYLVESDATRRALERKWKASDSPRDLIRYISTLLSEQPNDSHEIESHDGDTRIYIEKMGHGGVSWQVTRPQSRRVSGSISGSGPIEAQEIRSAVSYFYGKYEEW